MRFLYAFLFAGILLVSLASIVFVNICYEIAGELLFLFNLFFWNFVNCLIYRTMARYYISSIGVYKLFIVFSQVFLGCPMLKDWKSKTQNAGFETPFFPSGSF